MTWLPTWCWLRGHGDLIKELDKTDPTQQTLHWRCLRCYRVVGASHYPGVAHRPAPVRVRLLRLVRRA